MASLKYDQLRFQDRMPVLELWALLSSSVAPVFKGRRFIIVVIGVYASRMRLLRQQAAPWCVCHDVVTLAANKRDSAVLNWRCYSTKLFSYYLILHNITYTYPVYRSTKSANLRHNI